VRNVIQLVNNFLPLLAWPSIGTSPWPIGISKWGSKSLVELKGLDRSGPKRVGKVLGSSVWAQSRC
jgi:hypothetical protein